MKNHHFTFICSLHGEQEFEAIIFAGLLLKCGCHFIVTTDGGVDCLKYKTREEKAKEDTAWEKQYEC
jgi:hypothetical protein